MRGWGGFVLPPERPGAGAWVCWEAVASSYCWKGRPSGLCSWQQACTLMEDLCANWEQRCAPCSSAGLPG